MQRKEFKRIQYTKDIYQEWLLGMVIDLFCSFAYVHILSFYSFLWNKNQRKLERDYKITLLLDI